MLLAWLEKSPLTNYKERNIEAGIETRMETGNVGTNNTFRNVVVKLQKFPTFLLVQSHMFFIYVIAKRSTSHRNPGKPTEELDLKKKNRTIIDKIVIGLITTVQEKFVI